MQCWVLNQAQQCTKHVLQLFTLYHFLSPAVAFKFIPVLYRMNFIIMYIWWPFLFFSQSKDQTVFFFDVERDYKPIGYITTPGPVVNLKWSPVTHVSNDFPSCLNLSLMKWSDFKEQNYSSEIFAPHIRFHSEVRAISHSFLKVIFIEILWFIIQKSFFLHTFGYVSTMVFMVLLFMLLEYKISLFPSLSKYPKSSTTGILVILSLLTFGNFSSFIFFWVEFEFVFIGELQFCYYSSSVYFSCGLSYIFILNISKIIWHLSFFLWLNLHTK